MVRSVRLAHGSTYKLQTRTLQGVGSHGGSRHDSVWCLFVLSYCAGQLHALIGDRDTHELVVSEAGTTLRAAGQALERQVR